jgi:hypothetical protein
VDEVVRSLLVHFRDKIHGVVRPIVEVVHVVVVDDAVVHALLLMVRVLKEVLLGGPLGRNCHFLTLRVVKGIAVTRFKFALAHVRVQFDVKVVLCYVHHVLILDDEAVVVPVKIDTCFAQVLLLDRWLFGRDLALGSHRDVVRI